MVEVGLDSHDPRLVIATIAALVRAHQDRLSVQNTETERTAPASVTYATISLHPAQDSSRGTVAPSSPRRLGESPTEA